MALEFDHGGQQRPDPTVAQPDQPIATRDIGLELDPGGGDATLLGRHLALGDLPVMRFDGRQLRAQHVGDLSPALACIEVPGECHQIPPIAVLHEELRGAIDVALFQCVTEIRQDLRDGILCSCIEHPFLPLRSVALDRKMTHIGGPVEKWLMGAVGRSHTPASGLTAGHAADI